MTSLTAFVEARKGFICFDEPRFKSVFKITIIHDESLMAMSNMPIENSKDMYEFFLINRSSHIFKTSHFGQNIQSFGRP